MSTIPYCDFKNPHQIAPNFFMTKHAIKGLSVDWSKYASPDKTLINVNSDLTVYGIAEIKIENFRKVIEEFSFPLNIQHHPIREETETEHINRAHTLIVGFNERNTTKIRRKISKITNWADNMSPIIEKDN